MQENEFQKIIISSSMPLIQSSMTEFALYALVSYLVGNFCFGYYIVKVFSGKDIKELGSGNIGATNAYRAVGAKGYILTFLFDAFKGFAVVFLGMNLDLHSEEIFLLIICVTCGHIFPVLFKFKGGKGVSTFTGAMLTVDFYFVIPFFIIFFPTYLIVRNHTIAGLISYILFPVYVYLFNFSIPCVIETAVVIFLITYAHKTNIQNFIKRNN